MEWFNDSWALGCLCGVFLGCGASGLIVFATEHLGRGAAVDSSESLRATRARLDAAVRVSSPRARVHVLRAYDPGVGPERIPTADAYEVERNDWIASLQRQVRADLALLHNLEDQ